MNIQETLSVLNRQQALAQNMMDETRKILNEEYAGCRQSHINHSLSENEGNLGKIIQELEIASRLLKNEFEVECRNKDREEFKERSGWGYA